MNHERYIFMNNKIPNNENRTFYIVSTSPNNASTDSNASQKLLTNNVICEQSYELSSYGM